MQSKIVDLDLHLDKKIKNKKNKFLEKLKLIKRRRKKNYILIIKFVHFALEKIN